MTLIYQTCESAKQNPLILKNGCQKIDATLISAKMNVINNVYTNLWCFQEQIIKKYIFIIVFSLSCKVAGKF